MADARQHTKRLIEVDLPIRKISAHARREKSLRHAHISTLHMWWARRPLASCRAVLLAALWPDPADPFCPIRFRHEAALLLKQLRDERGGQLRNWEDPMELRAGLLDLIADFANWDLSNEKSYLNVTRALTQVAHESLGGAPGTRPLVIDPFAGGGAIPFEALRVGADVFASDLNPIAVLLNRVLLEFIPRHGQQLADEVRTWGEWVAGEARKELAELYPSNSGESPIAWLWARTIRCEGPGCGAELPLIRSLSLSQKKGRSQALRIVPNLKTKTLAFEIAEAAKDVSGTVRNGSATCPLCNFTTPNARVRAQLSERHGGTLDARLLAVVVVRSGEAGRAYRLPNVVDLKAVEEARKHLTHLRASKSEYGLSAIPDELIPPERPSPNARGLSAVTRIGIRQFGELFTPRQAITLSTFARVIRRAGEKIEKEGPGESLALAVQAVLGLSLSRLVDRTCSLSRWRPQADQEKIESVFGRQALAITWDFAEGTPFSEGTASWADALEAPLRLIEANSKTFAYEGHARQATATAHPLPDDAAQAFITDPPYYDAVPYADLSDFFYVWLRRCFAGRLDDLFGEPLTPKDEEAIWNPSRVYSRTGKPKDEAFYESQMARALGEARRVTGPAGIGVVVFAHKSTSGWEAILSALVNAGWIATASWPIDTEMGSRVNAMGTASLASSVHIVCRPREDAAGNVRSDDVGDWRTVLEELPVRMREWLPRLAEEGVVGADAIFACLGPALEIFSRHSRVEKVSGEPVSLREYLEQVWGAVSKEALSMIFRDADTSGLEEDARITAMWLWTLAAPGTSRAGGEADLDPEVNSDGDSKSEAEPAKTVGGFVLEFDAARKIAQGLGARLEALERVVEVKGDEARLLSVAERAKHLFGKNEGVPTAKKAATKKQMTLFSHLEGAAEAEGWGEVGAPKAATTTLDRVHQAMLLFGAGRGEAMKRFLVEEGVGKQGQFWKLAQSLSALYPSGSDEKRWVDGVLARKKGLGFG